MEEMKKMKVMAKYNVLVFVFVLKSVLDCSVKSNVPVFVLV